MAAGDIKLLQHYILFYMRWMVSLLPVIACTLIFAADTRTSSGKSGYTSTAFGDTVEKDAGAATFTSNGTVTTTAYSLNQLDLIIKEKRVVQFLLGKSQQGRKIDGYYFPGTSDRRALVIAGVHGSELSSVEVAYRLLDQLLEGKQPYYSVIIVPSLFPDNVIKALNVPGQIGSPANIGRYTFPNAVDPNRQMPSPGKAYDGKKAVDYAGREIEIENQLLLELIQSFKPQRIANIHAIRNMDYGGIYADPRTDHKGIALGYSSDSSLAVQLATLIHRLGGNVAGNNLDKKPNALYYKDPLPASKGVVQKRKMTGIVLNAKRESGVSLGTWGSTSIANEKDSSKNRDAIRILTIEYPGYKRSVDYTTKAQQLLQQKQVELFASAITSIFLEQFFVEDDRDNPLPGE